VARRGVTNFLDIRTKKRSNPNAIAADSTGESPEWRLAMKGPAMLTSFREPADQQGPMRESWCRHGSAYPWDPLTEIFATRACF